MSKRLTVALVILGALGLAIGAGVFSGLRSAEVAKDTAVKNAVISGAEETYLQALEDIEIGNYKSGGTKLNLVEQAWQGVDEGEKLLETAKKELYNKAVKATEEEEWQEAKGLLDALVVADPDYRDARKQLDEVNSELGIDASTESQVIINPATGEELEQVALPPDAKGVPYEEPLDGPAKDIPEDAKPFDLIARGLPGFKTVQRGAVAGEEGKFGGTYLPTDPRTKGTVERVLTTVVKASDKTEAEELLTRQKGVFPNDNQTLTVNRHSAYFGIYNIGDAKVFPPIGTVAWSRGDWYFAVEVLPAPKASVKDKREMALFAARAWGY